MKKGEYVEMWYFTNNRIRATEMTSTKTFKNNNLFVFIYDEDNDACSSFIIEDKDLFWKDFTQATPHIVHSMEQNDWPPDCINMFIEFWTTLENHS